MIRTHIFFAFALLSCAAAAAGSLQQQIDAASNAGGGRVVLRSGVQNAVKGVLRGRGRKGWLARHEAILEAIRNGPGHYDIVMVGDSITDLWQHPRPGGKEVAERYFGKWNTLNLGVMGDLVENIIWRLENGEADGYAAKVVMVLAGTNNIGKGASGEEVAAATERLVELLRTKHPEARIVLLPILPRDDRRKSPDAAARIATANELSRKLVDGKTVFGLDFSRQLVGADGAIDAALFKKDRLHLNASGYGVWAGAALPVFEKLLATPPPPQNTSARCSTRSISPVQTDCAATTTAARWRRGTFSRRSDSLTDKAPASARRDGL